MKTEKVVTIVVGPIYLAHRKLHTYKMVAELKSDDSPADGHAWSKFVFISNSLPQMYYSVIASLENGSRGNGPRRLIIKASRIFQINLVFGADNIMFLLLGEQNANMLSLRDSINRKFAAQNLSALSKAECDHHFSPI